MAKKKFEFKRYNYISENKYFNTFKVIMNKNNHDWLDTSEYTWDVHTWTPRTITTTNVPTITTTASTAGEESTRYYYDWLTAPNTSSGSLYYTDFTGTSDVTNNTISVSMDNGWRVL